MVHFAHFRKVNVSARLRSVTLLRAARAKRGGPLDAQRSCRSDISGNIWKGIAPKISGSYLLNLRWGASKSAGFEHTPRGGCFEISPFEIPSNEPGATAIEYGLIAAGISIAILAAVNGLGSNLNTMFSSVNSSLK